jgi:hypothetical protein
VIIVELLAYQFASLVLIPFTSISPHTHATLFF